MEDLQNEKLGHKKHVQNNPLSSRHSLYQACTEFSWFRTTSDLPLPFRDLVPIQFYYDLCRDVFGSKFTPEFIQNIHALTLGYHGAENPLNTSNNIFIYGRLNPNRLIGIGNQVDPTALKFDYKNYGRTNALNSISVNDSSEVFALKLVIKSHIKDLYRI